MNRTARTATCAAAVTALLFGLGACAGVEEAVKAGASQGAEKAADELLKTPYEVTYEVTGKDVVLIKYSGGKGTDLAPEEDTVDKPAVPWQKTVTLKGAMPPSVMPEAADMLKTDADIACKIVYKGKVLAEAKGQKAVMGGCIAAAPMNR
ncbi:MmpS family transport accessory protein [Streptomyces candidus]|uniref:Uncharacterized protein n=1 Tax=Streptomyces candidus TaxID=67283 RepID=A0A7X0LPK3_9ACTN|nr:MmpS family transport accessory protein [Streptomyces candidus]MBB6435001.1 hypothetical protein [Streptomyces candidus]GHH41066.1 hypothetical protein GCM10018773_23680 [Streptomyces candidus]